jgi:hypothetical protein
MVIFFVLSGIVFGSAAAGFTFMSSGSVLLAIGAYTLAGTIGAVASVMTAYLIQENSTGADWPAKDTGNEPVSA